MLGNATSPNIAAIKPGAPVQALPGTPQAPVKVDRLAPISLNDPELDGGTDLLGAAPRVRQCRKNPRAIGWSSTA